MTRPEATDRPAPRTLSFETARAVHLSIELNRGLVHVLAGNRTDSVVTVNPSDPHKQADIEAAQATAVDFASGRLFVRAPKPRGIVGHLGLGRTSSVDITVEVPRGSSLTAEAGLADFRCDGRLGDVDIRTGAGSVRLDQAGVLQIHSGAGRVAVEGASGDAEIVSAGDMDIGTIGGDTYVKNLNGKTRLGRVGGDLRVKSANGDIIVGDSGGDVTAKTANGDIRVGQVARGSVVVETAAGGLEIGISEGTAAWIEANTKFGQIHNSLSPTDQPETATETVQIRARTAFGDIRIKRP